MKKIFVSFFLLSLFIIVPNSISKASAFTIFQDNFDDGVADGWNPLQPGWVVSGGKYGALISSQNKIIHSVAGDITTPNYNIDLDITPIQGDDKNVTFRWSNNQNRYEVHFTGGLANIGGPIPIPPVPYPMLNGNTYHIKVALNGQNIKFYVGNTKLFDFDDPNYQFPGHEQMGLRIGTGSTAPSEVYFDNIVVSTNDANNNLNVPLFKQTDPLWGGLLYDSANLWAQNGETTISRWGCALTSAVMLLKYYHIDHLPDGTDINPHTLNDWFEANSKSYIENGYVNWLDISKLSHSAKSENPDFQYDMLEFDPFVPATNSQLIQDVQNLQPDIIGVTNDSHFVITTGTTSATLTINDPFFNKTSLSDYGNTFSSIKHFSPAHSDGSYIELFVNPLVTISVKDENGNSVGGVFTEQPLVDDIGGESSGDAIKVYYVKKPATGKYYVTLSSLIDQSYHLESDLFDSNANDITNDFNGELDDNKISDTYVINFNHDDVSSDSIFELTIASLVDDINILCESHDIDNSGICNSLLSKANNASIDNNSAGNILNAMINDINAQRGKHINEKAFQILNSDLQGLISNL